MQVEAAAGTFPDRPHYCPMICMECKMPPELPPEAIEDDATPTDPSALASDPTPSPDPATIPTVDPSESPELTAPPASAGARDAFAARYDVSEFSDDTTFVDAVASRLDQAHSDQPLIDLGRQFAPHAEQWPQFLEWQKEQAVGQAAPPADETPPATDEPASFEWDYPEPNENDLAFLERDPATGLYRPKQDWIVPPGTAERVNQQVTGQRTMAERLVTQFPSLVNEVTGPVIEGLRSELAELKAAFTTSQERQDSATYMQQRAADFYQHDEQGNPVIDQQTGQPALSPVGKAQQNAEGALRELGISDPAKLREAASLFVGLQQEAGRFEASNGNGQPAPAAQAAPQTGAQKRALFIRTTTQQHSPDRGGTIPDPTAPEGTMQNPSASFSEILDAEVAAGGGL